MAANNKGAKATAAQKAALERGRKKRDENRKAREAAGHPDEGRWGRVLDGTLKIKDLDDEEIERCRVRGKNGFEGGHPVIPSHIAQQFQSEAIRRANAQFRSAAPKAVKRLLEIAEDSDTKDSDAIRALAIILERALGKTPETIRITGESSFDKITMEALGVDRHMADDAGIGSSEEGQ